MPAQRTPSHVEPKILRHVSIAITNDTNGHPMADDKRPAAEAMSSTLFDA